jgi:5-methylcytosine-specific restriction endonuclease McrA
MNIDHVYPKSQHGSNHDFNVVLAHRKCNQLKGSQHPYLNANGEEVKAKPMLPTGIFIPDIQIRDEWKPYLFL